MAPEKAIFRKGRDMGTENRGSFSVGGRFYTTGENSERRASETQGKEPTLGVDLPIVQPEV